MLGKLNYNPLRAMERSFDSLPRSLMNMTGMKFITFKRHLDKLMMKIPDQPIYRGHDMYKITKSNVIYDQEATTTFSTL